MQSLIVLALSVSVAACSHGGNVPGPDPYCSMDTHVQPCPDGGKRDGELCALCDDANYSLTCQYDTGKDYLLAVCVDSCASCAQDAKPTDYHDTAALDADGIHVCANRYRASSWCATCDSLDKTLTANLCDKDGFCDPVVCVASCNACELAP